MHKNLIYENNNNLEVYRHLKLCMHEQKACVIIIYRGNIF
jgi:hypothetical protein